MVPHSEPSAPGDHIRPYCDSCQPLDSTWQTVSFDPEKRPISGGLNFYAIETVFEFFEDTILSDSFVK